MIIIDGSKGEGGGQVLRTALALSMVTGKAFRMEKVRARRPKPGLLRQHLTALRAAAEVCGAEVTGDELGSRSVSFTPGKVKAGRYEFKIGSAGSTTLVLQTVLPALLVAEGGDGKSEVVLEGGTHNPMAPPFDFLEKAFLPVINRMGPKVTATLERPGFYPAGGGRMRVSVEPVARLRPVEILERGRRRRWRARAVVAGVPRTAAEWELNAVIQMLGWAQEQMCIETLPREYGPGNVLILELGHDKAMEVFTGFGEKGVSAEEVARRAVGPLQRYVAAEVPVGEHLADQLMVPLAMAGGGAYRTMTLTEHAKTNREVIGMFLEGALEVQKAGKGTVIVRAGNCRPAVDIESEAIKNEGGI